MTSNKQRKLGKQGNNTDQAEQRKEGEAFYEKASATLLAQQDPNPKDTTNIAEPGWNELRGHLENRINQLYAWRQSWWMQNWSDLAEFILPRRSIWLTQSSGGIPTPNNMTRGREINKSIMDPTATYAARVCSGGLVSGLASPSRPWFKTVPATNDIDTAGRIWLDETEDRVYKILAGSNFYDSFAQETEDVLVFGTAPCIIYEDEEDIIHCYNPCVGEYFLANGATNRVNGLARRFLQTAAQSVDFFGVDKCPADIKQLWAAKGSNLDQENIIAHFVEPNFGIGKDNIGVVPGGYAWREVYWVYGNGSPYPLSTRGFHEQPFTVSRWSLQSNDPYGRSPGMDVLPDVMQLQVMTRRMAEAIEKQVRPPLLADMSMKNQPSSSLPGHVTYVASLGPGTGMRPIYDVNPDIAAMAQNIAQIEMRIKTGLFVDLFLMLDQANKDMTAYEVAAKLQEKLAVLGPVIESMLGVLKQKLKRVFKIMQRRGLIDPPPDSLKGVPINIEFVSMLALSQKAAATGGLERIASLIGNMTPIFPEAKDLLDADAYLRLMNELLGNQQKVIRSPEQVEQIRQMQQKAAQASATMNSAHAMAQTASVGADAAQTLSQTQVGGGANALSQLFGQGGTQ